MGGRLRQPLRHRRGRHRARAGGRARPGARDRRPGRAAGPAALRRTRSASSCCRRRSRCSSSGCAAAARTARRRSSGGSQTARARGRARSPSTTTSSSTTSSTRASIGCASIVLAERARLRVMRAGAPSRIVGSFTAKGHDSGTVEPDVPNAFEFVDHRRAPAPGSCCAAARRRTDRQRQAGRVCAQKEIRRRQESRGTAVDA